MKQEEDITRFLGYNELFETVKFDFGMFCKYMDSAKDYLSTHPAGTEISLFIEAYVSDAFVVEETGDIKYVDRTPVFDLCKRVKNTNLLKEYVNSGLVESVRIQLTPESLGSITYGYYCILIKVNDGETMTIPYYAVKLFQTDRVVTCFKSTSCYYRSHGLLQYLTVTPSRLKAVVNELRNTEFTNCNLH